MERERRGRTSAPARRRPSCTSTPTGFDLGGPGQAARACSTMQRTSRGCSSSTRSKRRRCSSPGRSGCSACRPSSSDSRRADFSAGRSTPPSPRRDRTSTSASRGSRSQATSSRRTASTRACRRCSTCCRCRTGPTAASPYELLAAGNIGQPALEQPAAARQPQLERQQRLGRAAHVQFEPVRLGDHRGAGPLGLLRRRLHLLATAR